MRHLLHRSFLTSRSPLQFFYCFIFISSSSVSFSIYFTLSAAICLFYLERFTVLGCTRRPLTLHLKSVHFPAFPETYDLRICSFCSSTLLTLTLTDHHPISNHNLYFSYRLFKTLSDTLNCPYFQNLHHCYLAHFCSPPLDLNKFCIQYAHVLAAPSK